MAEVLHGNVSSDQLNARNDKTQVYGLKGNDTLTSNNKSDVLLVGGSGDDSLIMTGGNGTLSGGDGSDTFELTYSATKKISAVIEDLEPSEDKIIVNFDGDISPQILSSTTTDGNVILRDNTDNLNVTVKGVRDNDYFDGDATNQAWKVLELTNAEREANGKSSLTMSDGLTAGAEIRVEEITSLGKEMDVYEHMRPYDKGYYDTVLNNKYNYPGENLDGGARSPAQVMTEWMNSDDHRENILRDNFQKLGVGYNEYDADPSNLRFYWTQLFADSLKAQSLVDVSTASPQVNAVLKFIQGDDEPNTISNSEYGVTIDAKGGNDSISNSGLLVSISGGNDNDTINNSGSFSTIKAGGGNDVIQLGIRNEELVIEYALGDGNDTVSGLNSTDTVSISGDEFTPAQIGNDIIVTVGSDSITLLNAAIGGVQLLGSRSKLIILTDGDDSLDSTIDGVTITALDGNDYVESSGDNVTIDGGAGNDSIFNDYGSEVSINSGTGNDTIINDGDNATINGSAGNDYIYNDLSDNVSIDGGDGNDTINNDIGDNVIICGSAGNDSIYNDGDSVTVDGGAGDDTIENWDDFVSISGGAGNDSIENTLGYNVTIDGGDGDDDISNDGKFSSLSGGAGADSIGNDNDNVTIDGGADNDLLFNEGDDVTINGGTGNDVIYNFGESSEVNGENGNDTILSVNDFATITGGKSNDLIIVAADDAISNIGIDIDAIGFSTYSQYNVIRYTAGDGNDSIVGFDETDLLQIGDGTGTYSAWIDGDNIVVRVDRGSVTLLNAANVSVHIDGIQSQSPQENYVIYLTESNATCNNSLDGAIIAAADSDCSIENSGANTSIIGNAGNDFIVNAGENAVIFAAEGDDSIFNSAENISIGGSSGDDLISLSSDAKNNLIEYMESEGRDTIIGFDETDTLRIVANTGDYSSVIGGEKGTDVIINVGAGFIILADAAKLVRINTFIVSDTGDGEEKFITLTEGNDFYQNVVENATIAALGGNDSVGNYRTSVSINGGNGDDSVNNFGSSVTVDGSAGNDTISNLAKDVTIIGGNGNDYIGNQDTALYVTIDAGAGNDDIYNAGANVSIDMGAGSDYLENRGDNAYIFGGADNDTVENWRDLSTILGGDGDDSIDNTGANVSIDGGADNDTIDNSGAEVVITSGDGNDSIYNGLYSHNSTLDTGDGDDTITNRGDNAIMLGGAGNDTLNNRGANATIIGSTGNDEIHLTGDGANSFIQYTPGDGDDTIWGLTENSRIQIGNGLDTYSTVGTPSGDDIIIRVGNGSITLKNFRDNPEHVIIGESGTSGGGSGSGGSGGGSSSGGSGDGGGRGGNDGGNTSGGTSANEGRGSDASGGKSAVGSRGRNSSTSNDTSGDTVRSRSRSNRLNLTTPVEHVEFPNVLTPSTQLTTTTQPTANQHVYSGGNQVVSDYQSGEKIVFGEVYTGSFYDGAGNYCVGSSTGALVIQNAMDKVIDLSDVAGNDFVKAYAATTAGVIDGRGLAGFEIINGSAGADAIFAGDGGSQLWGGADYVQDIMVGGGGTDIFISGRTQGADIVLNASSTDIVHLNDATLSDIIATEENNGVIAVAFNTGNVIAVQSSEALSATFMLTDGSMYRFNHVTKNWQTT